MPTRAKSSRASGDSVAARTRAYFAAQPPAARRALRLLQTTIARAAPGAEPTFSYGIPGFRFGGKALVWYAAWADRCSMYPITAGMRAAGGAELARYAASKGTLRFPSDKPIPVRFVTRLVKARVKEIESR